MYSTLDTINNQEIFYRFLIIYQMTNFSLYSWDLFYIFTIKSYELSLTFFEKTIIILTTILKYNKLGVDKLDTSGVTQLIIILILILLAAFFASVKSAFSSVNKLRIKTMADEGDEKAIKVYALLQKPTKMYISVLIANIIIVVAAATLTIVFTYNTLGSSYVILALLILTILIIIFSEIIPKDRKSVV